MHGLGNFAPGKTAARRMLVAALAIGTSLAPWMATIGSAQEPEESRPPEFRVEIASLVDRLLTFDHPLLNTVAFETLEDVRSRLYSMSDAELQELEVLTLQVTQMNKALSTIAVVERQRVQRIQSSAKGFDGSGQAQPKSGGLPSAAYPNLADDINAAANVLGGAFTSGQENEPDAPPQNSVSSFGECNAVNRSTTLEAYSTRTAFIVLEAARDVADRMCAQSIGLLVAGGNASVLCIPMDFAYIVGKSIHDNLGMCDDFIDGAEIEGTYERLAHLHGDLETNQNSLYDLDTDLSTHNVALTTHDTLISNKIIANQNIITTAIGASGTTIVSSIDAHDTHIKALLAENSAFFTRLEIEEALLNQEREAVYYLPAAQGGKIELARAIVAETIANVTASEEGTHAAADLLTEADALIATANYKMAFSSLGSAYFDAIKKDRKENQPSNNSIP